MTTTNTRPARRASVKGCPHCRTVLAGGPVLFYCATCKRSVYAADLATEFPVTLGRAA